MVASGPQDPSFTDVGRLVVRCPDRPGIVHALSGVMTEFGANITDSQQHSSDPSGGTFTLRLEFVLTGLAQRRADLEKRLTALAGEWRKGWRLAGGRPPPPPPLFVCQTEP